LGHRCELDIVAAGALADRGRIRATNGVPQRDSNPGHHTAVTVEADNWTVPLAISRELRIDLHRERRLEPSGFQ
jgi:hypothetical protein